MNCGRRERHEQNRGNNQGYSRTPEYKVWLQMIDRCSNPKNSGFRNYGGRGIHVCPQWQGPKGFQQFISDMGWRPSAPARQITIERVNNDDGYNAKNCRWATFRENSRNKRDNRKIEIDGVTKIATEWAESVDMDLRTFLARIDRGGMSPKDALETPDQREKAKTRLTVNNETRTLKEWSKISGIAEGTIQTRIDRGWSIQGAVFQPLQPGRRKASRSKP